jgi:hypothetical protein
MAGGPTELDPVSWLARDFGTDPADGLDAVAGQVLARTRLVAADRAAVRAVLDVATRGSAWRAFQLKDPMNITILGQMRAAAAAAGASTDAEIVVENAITQIRAAMFPYPSKSAVPIVAPGSYFTQWWSQHVRRR